MIRIRPIAGCAVAMLATALTAEAQTPVDRTVATPATGTVEVSNVSGSVVVRGWDRAEVRVTGSLGEGTERLDVTTSGDRVAIRVIIPERARNVQESTLEIRVPAGKNVSVRTVSAEIEISGVRGAVDGQATSGSVLVSGDPRQVRAVSTSGEVSVNATTARVVANSTSGDVVVTGRVSESVGAESVSGGIEVRASAPEVTGKSVSGDVIIVGASRRLAASTVSGDIEARGGRLQYGAFESVSGTLRFEGDLEPDAGLSFQSHSGDVELALPRDVGARFQLHSFSGSVRSAFGGQGQRSSSGGRGLSLDFTSGGGGSLITVKTFSGDVELDGR